MCLSGPKIKAPPPLLPPPPPEAGALELEEPAERKKRRGGPSTLESLRIPLNPTGMSGGTGLNP